MKSQIDWSSIADLYDDYVRASFDIPFFLNEAKKTSGPVLELMAGTGRVSIPMVEAGVSLTCVDSSFEMLSYLSDKLEQCGLSARLVQMDVRALALNQAFDLILIPFHSFSELVSPEDQSNALSAIRAHLSGTGRFICTMHNPIFRLRNVDGQLRLWGRQSLPGDEGLLLLWGVEEYNPETHIVNGIEFFEEYDADRKMYTKRILEIRFRLLEREEFKELTQSAGFAIEALYGDYEYAPFQEEISRFMIWVLRKA